MKLFLVVKDETKATVHAMPDIVAGFTDVLDEQMRACLYSSSHEREVVTCNYDAQSVVYNDIQQVVTRFEIACHPVEGVYDFERPGSSKSEISQGLNKLLDHGPAAVEDKEKWNLLTRELAQKQEIIHRMMKELDDKSHSLKLTSSEIIDLRRTIKMFQSENAILRKKLGEEEQLELSALVSKEI